MSEIRMAWVVEMFSNGYLFTQGWKKSSDDSKNVWTKEELKIALIHEPYKVSSDVSVQVPAFQFYERDTCKGTFQIIEDAWFLEFVIFINRMTPKK
ncbi:MAG: hypothetical protein ACRCXZ_09790 [Patescibacteria group bacterium]